MQVDPNQSGGGIPHIGHKIAHAVGYHRWTANSGTSMISVAFVIVADPGETNDVGCTFTERFAITEKAIRRLGAWAQATGHMEPFDSDDDETLGKVCAKGAVQVELTEDTYNGDTKIVPANWGFSRYNGGDDAAWEGIIAEAEANYQRRMNERKSFGGGNSGGGGGNGGGSRPSASAQRAADDDIPFAFACDGQPSWVDDLMGERRHGWRGAY